MKTDKIKNYNHYLLAILGTLGCIFLLLCIATMLPEVLSRRNYHDPDPHGLIADETAEVLNQENLRKQIISYESPWLVDTLNSIYIVPVSISTLRKPEEIAHFDEELLGLLNMYPSKSSKNGYSSRKHMNGTYANLIVYDPKKDATKSLFNERLVIGNVNMYYFDDDILLVFYTVSKDTNKNGIIDLDDTRDLCIYSMNTGRIRKISDDIDGIFRYQFIENSKDMLIQFHLGNYQPNQFDKQQTPCRIVKYEYDRDLLIDIIPKEIQAQMQRLVEGKEI